MSNAQWNLLVYAIAGDDREHQNVLTEIDQMRAALKTDQCNVAVQVMAKHRTTRYWISSNEIRSQILARRVDASHQRALTDFLRTASENHPASLTALVLRAHGSGLDHVHDYPRSKAGGLGGGPGHGAWPGHPMAQGHRLPLGHQALLAGARLEIEPQRRPDSYGCRWGPDPLTGHFLTNVTMKKAIAASTPGGYGRVDVLALNACWMATLEIEYELRSVAEIEVASQVNAKPLPYEAIVTSLSRHPAQSAEQLARTIVASVKDEIAHRHDAFSALWAGERGEKMEALATAFDAYAQRVTTLIEPDWQQVHDAVMSGAQRIDDPLQVDLVSLTRVLGTWDPEAREAAAEVRKQFRSMLIDNVAHPSHPGVHGMSIFCPKSTRIDLGDAYKGTEFRADHKSWATFLHKFQRRLARS
jgi:hypothetical protein